MTPTNDLPIAVIGAGPVGLAAAAHLVERGLRPLVLEAGPAVGHGMRQWDHVRLFSPWRYVVDAASKRALLAAGWVAPDDEELPAGREVVEKYLEPLASLDPFARAIRLDTRVVAVSRQQVDKVKTSGRDVMPFVLRTAGANDVEEDVLARAVIDASGTWLHPNPMGANGLPARGERAQGSRVFWGMRRGAPGNAFGGGDADALPARGALGTLLRAHVEAGRVRILTSLQVGAVEERAGALAVLDVAGGEVARVDEIVVATGARPDLDMLRELRLDLDPALESPRALGPLIDPNEHSCGSVRPHGAFELEQPEQGLFLVGMKSYGRAPTFLLATGYEQVRSVAAYLAGDFAAAREVLLDLPETGVCNVTFGTQDASAGCCGTEPGKEKTMAEEKTTGTSACCGGPAPQDTGACCVKDADAKAAGQAGCGCGTTAVPASAPAPVAAASCCR